MIISILILLLIIFDVSMYAYAKKALPKAEVLIQNAASAPNPDPELLREAATQVAFLERFASKGNLVLAGILLGVLIFTHVW